MRTSRAAKLLALAALTAVGLWYWAHLSARTATPEVSIQADKPIAESARLETAPADLAPREQVGAEPAPPNQVRIRVTNFTTHEPIAGANVEILSLDEALNDKPLIATVDGTVAVSADSLVGANVRASAAGYCPISGELPSPIEGTVTLQLCIAGSLRVRVLDENHTRRTGAFVIAIPSGQGVPKELLSGLLGEWPDFYRPSGPGAQPSVTDETGELLIERMPCGVPLNVTASRTIPKTEGETTIDPKVRLGEIEIVAAGRRCIHGRVVWDSGAPAVMPDGIGVHCLDATGPGSGLARTGCNNAGEFTLCDVPSGRVSWRVDWPGEYSRCTRVDSGVVEVGDIVLRRALDCEGRVYLTNAPKDFSYGGMDIAFYQDGRLVGTAGLVDDDGRFRQRLLVGSVQMELNVARNRIASVTQTIPSRELLICLDPFVGGLRVKNLEIDVRQKPLLKLVDVGGERRGLGDGPQVAHEHFLGGTESVVRWNDRDLQAWFLTPGKYDVYVGCRGDSTLICAGRAEIAPGVECVLDASKIARGSIRGTVKTSDGVEVAGTSVIVCPSTLLWSGAYKPHLISTDEHGGFKVPDAAPGAWTVFPESRGPESPEAEAIEVKPGTAVDVLLTMARPGGIEGTARRYGAAATGASVSIQAECDPSASLRPQVHDQKLGEDGVFRFTDLVPGRYHVSLYSGQPGTRERRQAWYFVDVRAGEITRVAIDLDLVLTTLNVTRHGAPFDTIDDGYVAGTGGVNRLERLDDAGTKWGVKLPDGPCLFLISSKDFGSLDTPYTPSGYLAAYVRSPFVASNELNVDLGGATLVIRRRNEAAELPWPYLQSIGAIADVAQYMGRRVLASTDDGMTRRVVCVPVGSTVLLESDRSSGGPLLSKQVVVGSSAEIEILWPPE